MTRYLPQAGDVRRNFDVRLLSEVRPEYVVFSSFEFNDIDRLQSVSGLQPEVEAQVREANEFLERLKADYTLDRQLGTGQRVVHDMEYVQPTIWVWKRKDLP